jgi:hypothetical protein
MKHEVDLWAYKIPKMGLQLNLWETPRPAVSDIAILQPLAMLVLHRANKKIRFHEPSRYT